MPWASATLPRTREHSSGHARRGGPRRQVAGVEQLHGDAAAGRPWRPRDRARLLHDTGCAGHRARAQVQQRRRQRQRHMQPGHACRGGALSVGPRLRGTSPASHIAPAWRCTVCSPAACALWTKEGGAGLSERMHVRSNRLAHAVCPRHAPQRITGSCALGWQLQGRREAGRAGQHAHTPQGGSCQRAWRPSRLHAVRALERALVDELAAGGHVLVAPQPGAARIERPAGVCAGGVVAVEVGPVDVVGVAAPYPQPRPPRAAPPCRARVSGGFARARSRSTERVLLRLQAACDIVRDTPVQARASTHARWQPVVGRVRHVASGTAPARCRHPRVAWRGAAPAPPAHRASRRTGRCRWCRGRRGRRRAGRRTPSACSSCPPDSCRPRTAAPRRWWRA